MTDSVRISFNRLFGYSFNVTDKDDDTLRSADESIRLPPVTSTQKIAVISETVREYSMVDKSSETEHIATYPVGVDVGGHLFVTSRVTLRKHQTSRLAMLYSRQ